MLAALDMVIAPVQKTRVGTKGEPDVRSFLFVIFVVLFELSFFFEKQFIDPLSLCGVEGYFEHFPIVLNVLPYDKTLHDLLQRAQPPTLALELDQCGFA